MQLTVEDDRTGMHSAAAISEGRRRADGSAGLTFRLVRAGDDLEAALTLAEPAHWESQIGYVHFGREKTCRAMKYGAHGR